MIKTAEEIKSHEIIIGKSVKVITDKKSNNTRVVSFPFEFPDESRGIIIVCRIKDEEWVPADSIFSINIEFK